VAERVDPVFALLAWWQVAWTSTAVVIALHAPYGAWCAAAWLLLLPPLLCRTVHGLWPVVGTHPVRSGAARRWWWLQQLQLPFNRLPLLEECLRLVPGLYQAWLALWGARISPWCLVAPRVAITDRQLVIIGRGAVLGDGCLLGAHLVNRRPDWSITVAPITIGRGAIVGAYAALAPGVVVADDEEVTATQPMPPFSRWEGGRRHLKGSDG
jgi:hypothetical protein